MTDSFLRAVICPTVQAPALYDGFLDGLTRGVAVSGVWLFFGVVAQAAILICLIVHWALCRKWRRPVHSPALIWIALGASVVLLVYAALRRDIVFVSGQLILILIGLRALDVLRRAEPVEDERARPDFPVIEPDSAEINLKDVKFRR